MTTMSSVLYAKYMVGACLIFATFTTGVVFLIRDLTNSSSRFDDGSGNNNGTETNNQTDNLGNGGPKDVQDPDGPQFDFLSTEAVVLLASAVGAVVLFTAYVVDGVKSEKKNKKKSSRSSPKSTSSMSSASIASSPRKDKSSKIPRATMFPEDMDLGQALANEARAKAANQEYLESLGGFTRVYYNCVPSEIGVMVEVPLRVPIQFSLLKSAYKFTMRFALSQPPSPCNDSTFVDSFLRNPGAKLVVNSATKAPVAAQLDRVCTQKVDGLYTEYWCTLTGTREPSQPFHELDISPSSKAGSASGWDDYFRSESYVRSSKELWVDVTVGCEQCGQADAASASFKCFRPRELSQNERESNMRKRIYGGRTFVTAEGTRYIQDRKMNHVSKYLEYQIKKHMTEHHLNGKEPSSSKGSRFSEDRFMELIMSASQQGFQLGAANTYDKRGKKKSSKSRKSGRSSSKSKMLPKDYASQQLQYGSHGGSPGYNLSPGQTSDEDSHSVWQSFSTHSTPSDYHSTPSPAASYYDVTSHHPHGGYGNQELQSPLSENELDLLLPLPEAAMPSSHGADDQFFDIDLSLDVYDPLNDPL